MRVLWLRITDIHHIRGYGRTMGQNRIRVLVGSQNLKQRNPLYRWRCGEIKDSPLTQVKLLKLNHKTIITQKCLTKFTILNPKSHTAKRIANYLYIVFDKITINAKAQPFELRFLLYTFLSSIIKISLQTLVDYILFVKFAIAIISLPNFIKFNQSH